MEFSISPWPHWENISSLTSSRSTLEGFRGYLTTTHLSLERQQGLLIVPIGVLQESAAPAGFEACLSRQFDQQMALLRIESGLELPLTMTLAAQIDQFIGNAKVIRIFRTGEYKGAHVMAQELCRADAFLETASYG